MTEIEKKQGPIAILVNADGTTERRLYTGAYRIVDYERGRVWSDAGVATVDGKDSLRVFVQIPWASFSSRTPEQELEAQKQYRRKPT